MHIIVSECIYHYCLMIIATKCLITKVFGRPPASGELRDTTQPDVCALTKSERSEGGGGGFSNNSKHNTKHTLTNTHTDPLKCAARPQQCSRGDITTKTTPHSRRAA